MTPRRSFPLLALALVLAGCAAPAADPGPAPVPDPGASVRFVDVPGALLETELGLIEVILYPNETPRNTANFQKLVEGGFYDGLLWHRVVDDFVIQAGDPSGSGVLGSMENVPLETHPDLHFAAGAVGMARDPDPDSANSQFFITEKPQPHLHDPQGAVSEAYGKFSLFGQVRRKDYLPEGVEAVHGLRTVRNLSSVPTIPGLDRPVQDVHILKATLVTLRLTEEEHAHYPLRTYGRASDGAYAHVLETPRAFHAGAPPVVVHWYLWRSSDSAPAFREAEMRVKGPSGEWAVPLAAHPEDALFLKGVLAFAAPGGHEVTFVRDGVAGVTFTVPVAP